MEVMRNDANWERKYGEVLNRQTDWNKQSGLENIPPCSLTYLPSKSIDKQGGIFCLLGVSWVTNG